MPYFLNAPASIATNSGACSSDTAGTETLMTLSGVSAENEGLAGNPNKRIREASILPSFMVCFVFMRLRLAYSKRRKMSRNGDERWLSSSTTLGVVEERFPTLSARPCEDPVGILRPASEPVLSLPKE